MNNKDKKSKAQTFTPPELSRAIRGNPATATFLGGWYNHAFSLFSRGVDRDHHCKYWLLTKLSTVGPIYLPVNKIVSFAISITKTAKCRSNRPASHLIVPETYKYDNWI